MHIRSTQALCKCNRPGFKAPMVPEGGRNMHGCLGAGKALIDAVTDAEPVLSEHTGAERLVGELGEAC